jgi:hypothetical protein
MLPCLPRSLGVKMKPLLDSSIPTNHVIAL